MEIQGKTSELLSEQQIKDLTGAKLPSKQAEILDRNGIYYITRMDKTIITTWHHVNNPMSRRAANNDEPDFSKVS